MNNNIDSHNHRNGKHTKEIANEQVNLHLSKGKKSVLWAYFWWMFAGLFGAHHVYLSRDYQAIVWFVTFGGYFGAGWLRDIYRIPSYVADENDEPNFVERFKAQVRANKKPPFSTVRFMGSIFTGYLLGQFVYIAVPEDEINGINLKPLILLVPLAVAIGIWLVGNIGREKGTIWMTLISCYLFYPTLSYFGDETTWIGVMATVASFVFEHFSKVWRLQKKERSSKKRRFAFFMFVLTIYFAIWASYFYFNATITDSDGEDIKLSEAVKHFLTSPIWLDLKASLGEAWEQAKHQGFWATWRQIVDLTDPRGEINAYKVLGLPQTASQSEITSRWRSLSKENHPDKAKGSEEDKLKAQERFMEIQQAYEILSSAKNRRQRKNRKATS